jgi:S-adenosylmethionine hydrolase
VAFFLQLAALDSHNGCGYFAGDMSARVVTFTTDFGLNDPFVGIMHGVVHAIHSEATITDICHAVGSYNILEGAWTIAQAYRFFPPRTVHVVVVDPGVGSARRPIIAETREYIFVAPDNGVLSLIEAREEKFVVRHVTADRYFLRPVSQTFHGRDIFAPVAGWLSKGVPPAEFGSQVTDYVRLPFPSVEHVGQNSLRGQVIQVDKFGNLITNIGEQEAPSLFVGPTPQFSILIAGQTITRLCHSYTESQDGEPFAIVGSSGYLEIAARQASAADRLAAGEGTPVGLVLGG